MDEMSFDEDRERRNIHFRAIGAFSLGMIAAYTLMLMGYFICHNEKKEIRAFYDKLHERQH